MNSRRKSAFSLVEVVLAVGIFSVAIVSILGLFGASIGGVRDLLDRDAVVSMGSSIAGKLDELERQEILLVPSGTAASAAGRPIFYAYAPSDLPLASASQDLHFLQWTATTPDAATVKGTRVFRATVYRALDETGTEIPFDAANLSFPVRVVASVLAPDQTSGAPAMTWTFHQVLIPSD